MPDTRDQIYNMLQSGLPLETSFALLELTDDQIRILEKDSQFQRKLRFYMSAYERNLLDRLEHIMDINESKGISTEIRWLLSRRFSDRWGSKQVIFNQNPSPLPPPTVGVYEDEPEDDTDSDPDEGDE